MTIGTSGRFREDSVQMQQVHTMNSEESSTTSTTMKTEDEEARKNVQKTNCGASSYVASSLIHLCEVSIDSYACDKCGIKFPTENMLNKHKMFHNLRSWIRKKRLNAKNQPKSSGKQTKQTRSLKIPEKMKYVCMCCSFTCNRKSTITIHMKKKHLDISCIICDLKCNDYSTLAKHMEKHRNSKTKYFKCNVCSFVSKKRGALVSHVVQTHRKADDKKKRITRRDVKSKEKKCLEEAKDPLNDSCTSSEFDCKDEVVSEPEDNKNFDKDPMEHCDLCDFTCTKRSTLYSHKRRHKVDVTEVYFCNECPFKTNKKSSLYSHRKRKHRPPKPLTEDGQPQLFYCAQCDYKNKNKYELRVHVARKHTNDFKFSCEICGKKFKVKGDLTNHIRFSHKEQPVMCDVCGKTCPNSNSLYVHQKFAHYKAQYECHLCKRRMVTQENLNEHLIKQHENRKAVMCEECGKTFSRNSRLKVHMRVHTGDKPYNCTICSKSFARRTAMKQHLLIHTGVRPYVCDICGKAFTQKPGLISHRKSHPGSHPPLPRIFIDHILQDVMNK